MGAQHKVVKVKSLSSPLHSQGHGVEFEGCHKTDTEMQNGKDRRHMKAGFCNSLYDDLQLFNKLTYENYKEKV
jgi:hypothetical protein